MSGNHNGRVPNLALPGQVQLAIITHPGPMATPVVVNEPGPGRLTVHQFGGLTRLEQVAATILAGMITGTDVARAVDLAEEVLAECARRQSQQEPPSNVQP